MSANAVVQRLPKPNWANVQRRQLYNQIYFSMACGTVAGVLLYFNWYIPKWKAIEDYQRNYDPFAEMERMRNLGLFSCCPPDYVIEEQKQKALAKQAKKK